MLCDELQAYIPTINAMGVPELARGYAQFASRLRQAQRYVLTRDVVWAITHVDRMKPSSVRAAAPFIRNPFPVTWIEFTFSEREEARMTLFGDRAIVRPGTTAPKRFGILVESDPEAPEKMIMSFAWSHAGEHSEPSLSGAACYCDVSEYSEIEEAFRALGKLETPEKVLARMAQGTDPDSPYGAKRFPKKLTREDIEAMAWIDNRARADISPYYGEAFEKMGETGRAQMMRMAFLDTVGEPGWAMAALILLNSRNALAHANDGTLGDLVDYSRLNKQRRKAGKPELLDHRVVTMRLSAAKQRVRSKASGESEETRRWHECAGHYKIRKSGVYWWHTHWRGDPTKGSVTTTRVVRS